MARAQSVGTFLDRLVHKRIDEIRTLRQIVLAVDPAITERVKWNAPSFCWEGDDRVTMRLHPGDRLELIFHRGAKPRDSTEFVFKDPTGRVEWAAADRGVFRVADPMADEGTIVTIVSAWLEATKGQDVGGGAAP